MRERPPGGAATAAAQINAEWAVSSRGDTHHLQPTAAGATMSGRGGSRGVRRKDKSMERRSIVRIIIVAAALATAVAGHSQTDRKLEAAMSTRASGSFDVNLAPLALDDKAADATLGRMSIDKAFVGDLEATSKGEMLTAMTAVKGSAGYVAIERVAGKLNGRRGAFVLQHTGTMTRGEQQLSIMVVPDSGTGELAGLAGRMTIKIEDGKHSYDFEYTLPVK